jgi:hypothetical protein
MYSRSHFGRSSIGYADAFHSANWENTSISDRLSSLQQLENENANTQGRQPRTLIAEDMPPLYDAESDSHSVTRGYYDPNQPDHLFINKDMVEQDGIFLNRSTGWACAQNVTHEGIHAAQNDVIEGKEVDLDELSAIHSNMADAGKMNKDFATYTNDMNDSMYAFRTSEYSARSGAAQRIGELHGQVSERFGKDDAYENLKEREEKIEEERLEDANRLFGTQFSSDEMNNHVASIVEQQYDQTHEIDSESVEGNQEMSNGMGVDETQIAGSAELTNDRFSPKEDVKEDGTTDETALSEGAEVDEDLTATEGEAREKDDAPTESAEQTRSEPIEGVDQTAEVAPSEENEPEKDDTPTESAEQTQSEPTEGVDQTAEVAPSEENEPERDSTSTEESTSVDDSSEEENKGESNDPGYDHYSGYGY